MGQKSVILAIVLIVLAVILAIVFVISRLSGGDESTDVKTPLEERKVVEVNSVIYDPLVFDGYTVELETNISDWVTERSFTVSAPSSALGSKNPELLVISDTAFKLPENAGDDEIGLGEGGKVRVRGKVEIYTKAELEDKLNIDIDSPEFALDDNSINRWELGPVILVNYVEKI